MNKLKKICLVFLVFLVITTFSSNISKALKQAYEINLLYKNDSFYLNNVTQTFADNRLVSGPFPLYENIYFYEIHSNDGNFLNASSFSFSPFVTFDLLNNEGKISGIEIRKLDEINLTVFTPYYLEAKEIIIYDEKFNPLLKIHLDDINLKLQAKNKAQDFTRIKPDSKIESQKTNKNYLIYIVVTLVVATILIILVILFIRHKKQTYE